MKTKRSEVIEVEFDGGKVVITDDVDNADFVEVLVFGSPDFVSSPSLAGDGPVKLEVRRRS